MKKVIIIGYTSLLITLGLLISIAYLAPTLVPGVGFFPWIIYILGTVFKLQKQTKIEAHSLLKMCGYIGLANFVAISVMFWIAAFKGSSSEILTALGISFYATSSFYYFILSNKYLKKPERSDKIESL